MEGIYVPPQQLVQPPNGQYGIRAPAPLPSRYNNPQDMPMPSVPQGLMFPRAPPSGTAKAEKWADSVLKSCGPVIRPMARLFLLCTFIEDSFRMAFQWDVQATHVSSEWQADAWVGNSFVAFNLAFQVVPCTILLLNGIVNVPKGMVQVCIAVLIIVVLAQSVAYHVLWNLEFFLRNLAVIGALCLVGAEACDPEPEKGGILDKSPRKLTDEDDEDEVSDILRLSGRVLIALMFLTLIKFDTTQRIILELMAAVLLALVVIGYKTKLSAVTLFIFLSIENAYLNDFFFHDSSENLYDFKKFNFFQCLTVIGGLLMLVVLGPGAVSFDGEDKKRL